MQASRRLDGVGDGPHPGAPVDVHSVVDEALREFVDASHLDVAVGGPLGGPLGDSEPAGVRREGERARGAERGHAPEPDVLQGLGEDLALGLRVAGLGRVLPEEGAGDRLGPFLELVEGNGSPPDVVSGSDR